MLLIHLMFLFVLIIIQIATWPDSEPRKVTKEFDPIEIEMMKN